MRGLFITGTDTGVGKTVLASAITAALHARGVGVRALKPVITGLEEPGPADHELLARAGGREPQDVAIVSYDPPMSPHLAAELAGRPIAPDALERSIADRARAAEVVIVEGVGGLLVPLSGAYDVRALAAALALPLVIAARPGLGTINHTLLTLEAARAAGLKLAAVVLTPWPDAPDTIERLEPELLAAAGRELPIDRWLGVNGSDRGPS